MEIDEDEDAEDSESRNEDMNSKNMRNMEILTDNANFENDSNNGFDDMD